MPDARVQIDAGAKRLLAEAEVAFIERARFPPYAGVRSQPRIVAADERLDPGIEIHAPGAVAHQLDAPFPALDQGTAQLQAEIPGVAARRALGRAREVEKAVARVGVETPGVASQERGTGFQPVQEHALAPIVEQRYQIGARRVRGGVGNVGMTHADGDAPTLRDGLDRPCLDARSREHEYHGGARPGAAHAGAASDPESAP